MCRPLTCSKCQKPSWAGCGAHVEDVLGGVPPSERCRCREDAAGGRQVAAAVGGGRSGLLDRLRGR